MAMRPRRGGVFQPRPSMRPTYERPSMRPPYERPSMRSPYDRPSMRPTYERTSMRPTYESFKPRFEWKYEENYTILLLYLPGFVMEQIRMETDKSRGSIQIQGQRLLGGGRWSNFNETFTIPPTCDRTQINTRFELGVLTIIIPNKSSLTTPQQQLPTTTTTTPPPPAPLEEALRDETTPVKARDRYPERVEAIVDYKNLDAMKEMTYETSSDDDHKLPNLEKVDWKKADKEANTIPDEKLPKAEEKDHMPKKGDAQEKVKAKNMEHVSDVVEKETVKSEEQVLLRNMVIAGVVLMGLGAHIFSIIGPSKTP